MLEPSDFKQQQITQKGNKPSSFFLKAKAALLHFVLGGMVIAPIALFIRFQLYPGVLLYVTGVEKILLIILVADLCLGPSLTFLVYKKNRFFRMQPSNFV